jgi:hypothetical protein
VKGRISLCGHQVANEKEDIRRQSRLCPLFGFCSDGLGDRGWRSAEHRELAVSVLSAREPKIGESCRPAVFAGVPVFDPLEIFRSSATLPR